MSVSVKTLKAFSGPDGRFKKDVEIQLPADRANWLVEQGFVERVDKPKAAPKAAKKSEPDS